MTTATPTLEIIQTLEVFATQHALNLTYSANGTPIGVYISDEHKNAATLQLEGIGAIIGNVAAIEELRQWVVGDCINLGYKLVGEKFSQFRTPKTFHNWAGICAMYAHHEREWVGILSFTIHAEVAYTDKPLRAQLLQRAYDEKLTAAELRALKNASTGKSEPPKIVRGMQRIDLFDALNGGFINERELAAALESGATRCRVEYVVSFEGD